MQPEPVLITPYEAARTLGCNVTTIARWALTGRLGYVTTPGGHRRFHKAEIEAIKDAGKLNGRWKLLLPEKEARQRMQDLREQDWENWFRQQRATNYPYPPRAKRKPEAV